MHTWYTYPVSIDRRGAVDGFTEARMSIRQAMLAILEQGPMYGYQLRAEFEQRTGETWPLNIGQVYTTLTRLERDGLVEIVGHGGADESDQDGRPDQAASDRQHVSYRATEAGRGEVSEWFATPVPRTQPARDELAIKLAIAVTLPGIDVGTIIQRQRSATMAVAAGLHPAQALGPRRPARRARRPRLEPGPRLARLRRRGRGALARPLRGEAAPRRDRARGRTP